MSPLTPPAAPQIRLVRFAPRSKSPPRLGFACFAWCHPADPNPSFAQVLSFSYSVRSTAQLLPSPAFTLPRGAAAHRARRRSCPPGSSFLSYSVLLVPSAPSWLNHLLSSRSVYHQMMSLLSCSLASPHSLPTQ